MLARSLFRRVSKPCVSSRFFSSSNSAPFKCAPTKVHLCDHPAEEIEVTKDELLQYYTEMTRVRRMEIESFSLYTDKQIRGFCHLYTGQEAVSSGVEAALKPTDHIITAYRCHAQQLLRGDTIKSIISEMLGKQTGCSRGKGGSMHLYFKEGNFHGGNGIVGAQIPVGAGLAFAEKYNGTDAVSVALYGDGAANQGQLHEAANMAALWKLPVIFLCENNRYGMGTAIDRAAAETQFYKRMGFCPGIQCDGMDVLSVRATMEHAVDWCRSGKGPIFVEVMTYRYGGHSMSDPGEIYRPAGELKAMRDKDCIIKVREKLLELEWSSVPDMKKIDKAARKEVADAITFAKAQTELPQDSMFQDIYKGDRVGYIRACNDAESIEIPVNP